MPSVPLPPGPREPKALQAYRYVRDFPALTADQRARHGASWTLRLPGLPDSVVTTDPVLVRHLLTGDPLRRRHANDVLEPALGRGSVLLLEPEDHLERRRMLLPPFHGERIKGYAVIVERLVDEELSGWRGAVRVHDRARALTLAIIQEVVLGSRDPAFARELTRLLDTFASPMANFGLFAPAMSRRTWWNLPAQRFHRRGDRLNALMEAQILAKRADPGDDLLSAMLDTMDDADLRDELKTLLVAGHETTATAIGWAADLLAHRPDAAAAIRDGDRAYVAAAAKEVMRLRTITPVSVGRTLLDPFGDLPADTVVLVDAHSLHGDPVLHPEPDAFRPQRFLDGGPPPYSYLPFGGGAHRCVGAALAALELEAALGAMVERFELSPVGPPERPVRRGITLVPAGGAEVRVQLRLREGGVRASTRARC